MRLAERRRIRVASAIFAAICLLLVAFNLTDDLNHVPSNDVFRLFYDAVNPLLWAVIYAITAAFFAGAVLRKSNVLKWFDAGLCCLFAINVARSVFIVVQWISVGVIEADAPIVLALSIEIIILTCLTIMLARPN